MKIKLIGTVSTAIETEDIKKIETQLGVSFPEDYVAFLLNQNGGYPEMNGFALSDGSNESVVNHFYSIGEMSSNLLKVNRMLIGEIPEGFISIGDDPEGNEILLGVSNSNSGQIFFWNHDVDPEEENPLHFLSKNLSEFLSILSSQ